MTWNKKKIIFHCTHLEAELRIYNGFELVFLFVCFKEKLFKNLCTVIKSSIHTVCDLILMLCVLQQLWLDSVDNVAQTTEKSSIQYTLSRSSSTV